MFGRKDERVDVGPVVAWDDGRFWDVVRNSTEISGGDAEGQDGYLRTAFAALPADDVVGFALTLDRLRDGLDTWALRGAAYVVTAGASDDDFLSFRTWLITHGDGVYATALTAPDDLLDVVLASDDPLCQGDWLDWLLEEVFADRARGTLDEAVTRSRAAALAAAPVQDAPRAEPFGTPVDTSDDAVLRALYPRLGAAFLV